MWFGFQLKWAALIGGSEGPSGPLAEEGTARSVFSVSRARDLRMCMQRPHIMTFANWRQ